MGTAKNRRSGAGGNPGGAKSARPPAATPESGATTGVIATPPMAMVRVTLHGLDEGDAEIEVAIDPHGELGAAWGEGAARVEAYDQLLDALIRELEGALSVLAES